MRNQEQSFRLKPLAQAVAVVCASMASNAVFADACTSDPTTTIAASTSDSCVLGNDTNDINVTVNTGVVLGTSGSRTGVEVATGIVAGNITNSGNIEGSGGGGVRWIWHSSSRWFKPQ